VLNLVAGVIVLDAVAMSIFYLGGFVCVVLLGVTVYEMVS